MSNKKKKSFALKLRNYFFTGVIVLIPIGFTLYLSKFLINFSTKLVPSGLNPNTYLPYAIPGIEIDLLGALTAAGVSGDFGSYMLDAGTGMEQDVAAFSVRAFWKREEGI